MVYLLCDVLVGMIYRYVPHELREAANEGVFYSFMALTRSS